MTQDLDTLLTAFYVKIDDRIGEKTRWTGKPPLLSDSELVCLAVAQALLGHHSEARWLRYTRTHLSDMFPYLPGQSGYNKRLRAALRVRLPLGVCHHERAATTNSQLRYGKARHGGPCLNVDQTARASSVKAADTRRCGSASTPSS